MSRIPSTCQYHKLQIETWLGAGGTVAVLFQEGTGPPHPPALRGSVQHSAYQDFWLLLPEISATFFSVIASSTKSRTQWLSKVKKNHCEQSKGPNGNVQLQPDTSFCSIAWKKITWREPTELNTLVWVEKFSMINS